MKRNKELEKIEGQITRLQAVRGRRGTLRQSSTTRAGDDLRREISLHLNAWKDEAGGIRSGLIRWIIVERIFHRLEEIPGSGSRTIRDRLRDGLLSREQVSSWAESADLNSAVSKFRHGHRGIRSAAGDEVAEKFNGDF